MKKFSSKPTVLNYVKIYLTVLGSFRTFEMDSSVSGLKLRSISFMLTKTFASEGISLILLWPILRVSRKKYWDCRTSTGTLAKLLRERSKVWSPE